MHLSYLGVRKEVTNLCEPIKDLKAKKNNIRLVYLKVRNDIYPTKKVFRS